MALSAHQLLPFTSPVNGPEQMDANAVRGNDNSVRTQFNAHDADATMHVQTGTLAARPAFGTVGQTYLTNDVGAVHLYLDTGSAWVQVT